MNKKTIVAFAAAALTGLAMARPGPGGFHGGHRGGFHHGGFHHGGIHHGYRGGFYGGHHHHYHRGWGYGLGAAALAFGTAAVVRDIVAPRTVVYSSYGTPVYTTYPYSTTYIAPTVYPTVYPTVVTYGVPPPPPRW